MACYKDFQQAIATDPNPTENRWLEQPLFYNPKIRWGNGNNKRIFKPESFGLPESAATLSLGQLFVNLKPLRPEHLESLGFKTKTVLDHNILTLKLAALIGEGKHLMQSPHLLS
jgi:hypothetical protein